MADRKTIAIIGDWGTGDEVAINLLQQVAALKPDVLIHLGTFAPATTPGRALVIGAATAEEISSGTYQT